MAFRISDGVTKIEVHSDSIVYTRKRAMGILSEYAFPLGWEFSILNGLEGPEHKTKIGRVMKKPNGEYTWLSMKNNRYVAEYRLFKNGKLGKMIRRL